MTDDASRMFMTDATGETSVIGWSAALSQAYDVLGAAGVVSEKRLALCHAAERDGRDPVAFAHHLVSLCSALSDDRSTTG